MSGNSASEYLKGITGSVLVVTENENMDFNKNSVYRGVSVPKSVSLAAILNEGKIVQPALTTQGKRIDFKSSVFIYWNKTFYFLIFF